MDDLEIPVILETHENVNELNNISAQSEGYHFNLNELVWVLDKNVSVNLKVIHESLSGLVIDGCLKTLSFYASKKSSSHTKNIAERFQHMLKATNGRDINVDMLINYRASLTPETIWYLGTIRGFLLRWHMLGYFGVDDDVAELLESWRIKGNRKGEAVKRMDPEVGPFSEIELQAFNEGVVRAYELDLIPFSDLVISLVTSSTGRRSVQISQLRVIDILSGKNLKDEAIYMLNIPRAKHGLGFREQFHSFSLTSDLWTILTAHAKNVVTLFEKEIGFMLQEQDRQHIPLFPDYKVAKAIDSPAKFRLLKDTDKLNISAYVVTERLKSVINKIVINSERTGRKLFVNARRFRYTIGTRGGREGYGELVIAELLDHSDTQNAGVYIKNIPEHVKSLDEAVGFQMASYAQAFAGVLIDSEKDATRKDDLSSRIRSNKGQAIGSCGEHGFCGANVPIPCYTCIHFQPWLDGPHVEVYQHLISERERINQVTGDLQVAAILDRSILAVADVILRCDKRRAELDKIGELVNG